MDLVSNSNRIKRLSFAESSSILAVERQGFDDGYFHNPRKIDFASQRLRLAYDTEFGRGVEQRARADAVVKR